MARDRRTLALIIILPILATVITAFRIRDLPKSQDVKKCEHCDVKAQKVHKIDSDKHKLDELKKTVRDKQQLINEKLASASKHKFDVKSDEDDDDSDLPLPKIKPGFKQELPKESNIDKSVNVKPTITPTKSSFGLFGMENDSEEEEDDDLKKEPIKPKIIDVKKTGAEKTKQGVKSFPKVEVNKQKVQISAERSDDDDDDDDDNDDSDDDSYEGLENVDELFKILDMKKKPSTKINKDEPKAKIQVEVKTLPQKDLKPKVSVKSKNDDDDDDDDDSDDDDDDDDDNELKITITKPLPPSKDIKDKNEPNLKKSVVKEEKVIVKQEQKVEPKPATKELKDKLSEIPKKPESKTEKPKNIADDKSHISNEKTVSKTSPEGKPEIKKVEEKKLSDPVKNEPPAQKPEKEKSVEKEKPQTDVTKNTKKEGKKEEVIKSVPESKNIAREVEKDTSKSKSQEKHEKNSQDKQEKHIQEDKHINKIVHEEKKTDKKSEPKKETATEHKKDIKYDFEKPNAYKDSHKSFDYSEFEKIQVSKAPQSRHKEKKADKTSAEKSSESREERYLKQVTDALNRRNLLKSEFEDFYAFFPTFAPNFSRIHNPECRRHGQILLRQLRGTKLWALNMLDATAKIPSGVLQGNGIQLGDFDQCLGSRARVQLDTGSVVKVQGKYCLARIDVKAEHSELEGAVYLAQAKSLIRSRIDDPGHFVPRFSTLSWGVCVPSACDREDVEVIIKDAVKHYQHKSGLVVKVKVDEEDCHTDDGEDWDEWLELPTVLTLSFYGVILLLVLVATVQEFFARRPSEGSEEGEEGDQKENDSNGEPKPPSDGILSQFSLYRSISKLTAPGTTDEIACIHGVRGVATLALLFAHKFMPVAVMPYTNRLKITEIASSRFWSWYRSGWIFTDCFLLLSGTLTSHRIGDDSTLRRIFNRYIRLTPALLAVVLFYAYIWDKLSTGPMWGSYVTKNAQVCQEGWWWNLLYVQNYFGLEDMCAPQTHQLALDMQLTILGTVVLLVVQSGQGFTKLLLPALHLIAAYFRYTTVRDHRLTLLAYHGVSVSQLYRTARLSYMSTLQRCSPYLIGISLGIALKKPSKHGKFLLTLGWLTSLGLWTLVFWAGLDSGSTQYKYNASFAAQYATIAPVASAMAIAWVIYVVHSGTCDFLARALCFRPLVFISRISYALYLCQFIIFITSIGTVRTSTEFTLMSLINVQEISAILLLSTLLTVTFVIPMQSLHKVFTFESKSSEPEKSPEKERKKSVTIEEPEKKELTPPTRRHLVAHREVLEEIPEAELEYETQRESTEGLEEILEEEEGTIADEEIDHDLDDLEIIEEEEAGEDSWHERDEREGERSVSRNEDIDEWEWTVNGSGRNGAQYYRYAR